MPGPPNDAREAADAATLLGHDLALCTALAVQTLLSSFSGETTAIETGFRAVAIADRSQGGRGHLANPRLFLGMPLIATDRLDEAEQTLQLGRRMAEELGHVSSLPLYHAHLGTKRFVACAWDDAIAEFEASAGILQDVGLTVGATVAASSWLTVIPVHRGQLEQAEAPSPALSGVSPNTVRSLG